MAFDFMSLAVQYGPEVFEEIISGVEYLLTLPEADREKTLADLKAKKVERDDAVQGLDNELARVIAARDDVRREIAALKEKHAAEVVELVQKHVTAAVAGAVPGV